MQEIEVGDYARTVEGHIGKIIDLDIDVGICLDNLKESLTIDEIEKHSKNIIDLIEVGDILKVHLPNTQKTITVIVDEYFEDSMVLKGIQNKNVFLKAIVTSEQFESIEYKI